MNRTSPSKPPSWSYPSAASYIYSGPSCWCPELKFPTALPVTTAMGEQSCRTSPTILYILLYIVLTWKRFHRRMNTTFATPVSTLCHIFHIAWDSESPTRTTWRSWRRCGKYPRQPKRGVRWRRWRTRGNHLKTSPEPSSQKVRLVQLWPSLILNTDPRDYDRGGIVIKRFSNSYYYCIVSVSASEKCLKLS